ncbi:disease resistance protein RML1B-like, partial [Selaginella moellendorffii]|uniref:disease resistance protein RML1B-like n=1 Tax=Selaginella moellendorffii TaxID=88036 RepID=UPI000D1C352F
MLENVDMPQVASAFQTQEMLKQEVWKTPSGCFQRLPNLEILKLNGMEFPLTSDWDWSRFPRLRTLEVRCYVRRSDFRVTSSMENLQKLDIEDNHHLEGLPFLTEEMVPMLSLSNCERLIGVPTISQLASLKFLFIARCPSLKDLSISFLPNLETVYSLFCNKVTTINISECPSLRFVKIRDIHRLARVAFGGNFPRLAEITLGGLEQLLDVSLGATDAFPQLTQLQIRDCGIDQLPEWFASLTTLRTLELWDLQNLDVIPDGVARLPLLRKLDLGGCKRINMLPFADSEDSSFYPSLEYLRLGETSVFQEHLSERLKKIASFFNEKFFRGP